MKNELQRRMGIQYQWGIEVQQIENEQLALRIVADKRALFLRHPGIVALS